MDATRAERVACRATVYEYGRSCLWIGELLALLLFQLSHVSQGAPCRWSCRVTSASSHAADVIDASTDIAHRTMQCSVSFICGLKPGPPAETAKGTANYSCTEELLLRDFCHT